MANLATAHNPLSSAYINSASDMVLSDDYLVRRFRPLQKKPATMRYEITRDAGYLHQYFALREKLSFSVWGFKEPSGQKDAYDDTSDIMVARIGNHVIGGCRLTYSHPQKRGQLPMEKDFILYEEVRYLMDSDDVYAEISCFSVLPEFRTTVEMLEFSRQVITCIIVKNVRYAFALTPVAVARHDRQAALLFGLKWQSVSKRAVAQRDGYEGTHKVLSVLDLTPLVHMAEKPEIDHDIRVTILASA